MNTLSFTRTSKLSFRINETELSADNFRLLLECIGYDVPINATIADLYNMSIESLPKLEADEFYDTFTKFLLSTDEERELMREMFAKRKHFSEYSSQN